MVSVVAQHDSPQPYRITLAGHRFAYDVALLDGSDPPALSDLRLVALNPATAIEKRDLITASNYADRLAAIAAKFARRDILTHDRATTERLRAGLAAAFGIECRDVIVHSYEAPGPVLVPAVRRGRGRPVKSIEFYRRVAEAAREAAADPDRRSIARGVQSRAALWTDVGGTPPLSTVERWLKRARKLDLYQGPRAQAPTDPPRITDRGEGER